MHRTAYPRTGLVAMTVPGISRELVAAGSSISSGDVRMPARFKLAGLLILPVSLSAPRALALTAANLRLSATDDRGQQLAFDTQGTQADSFEVSGLALNGYGPPLSNGAELLDPVNGEAFQPRWFAIDRLVKAGEVWRFTLRNTNPVDVRAFVAFRVESVE